MLFILVVFKEISPYIWEVPIYLLFTLCMVLGFMCVLISLTFLIWSLVVKYFSAYTEKSNGTMYTPIASNHSISNLTLLITYQLNFDGNSIAATLMNSSDNILFDNSSSSSKTATATNIAIKGGDRVNKAIAHIIVWLILLIVLSPSRDVVDPTAIDELLYEG